LWGLTPEGFDEDGYFCPAVDLTRPDWRSAVVAWLASQGHADAGASDAALLIALRHVCGLPPAPASESCDALAEPVRPQSPDRLN
jgi:hypothetical protein